MRLTERSLRRIARRVLAELFTKKSDFSVKHALGANIEDTMAGYGGLYDDPGYDFGEADSEDLEENEEDME